MVSGFHFSGDLFAILSASEDSRSLMGGSDVVHCVRVPLTGTTDGRRSGRMGVWLGLFCDIFLLTLVYNIVDYWGPLYRCL